MRGADAYNEPLLTTSKLEDFVPAKHPLRPIRAWVNDARAKKDAKFSAMSEADSASLPRIALTRFVQACKFERVARRLSALPAPGTAKSLAGRSLGKRASGRSHRTPARDRVTATSVHDLEGQGQPARRNQTLHDPGLSKPRLTPPPHVLARTNPGSGSVLREDPCPVDIPWGCTPPDNRPGGSHGWCACARAPRAGAP
jgi:hypothetical protein